MKLSRPSWMASEGGIFQFKRIIAMCLVVVACVGSLAVPADADVLNWISVLDYAMPNNGTSTQISLPAGTTTIYFSLPIAINLNLVDILVRTTSSDMTMKIGSKELRSTLIDTSYAKRFRFYGFANGIQYQNIPLTITTSTACTLFFDKFVVSPLYWADFADVGQFIFNYNSSTTTFVQPSNSEMIGHTFGANESGANPFNIVLSCPNWEKYDYVRFVLHIRCMEITSIAAMFGNDQIDYDVTKIYDGTSDMDTWFLEVTLDLTTLSRTASNPDPQILLYATARGGTQNYVRLSQTVGLIEAELNLDNHFNASWFAKFLSELQRVVSGTDNIWLELQDLGSYVQSLPTAIGQLISNQTSALEDFFITMTTSVRGMFTALNGWISDQTTALSGKIDTLSSSLSGWISAQTSALSSKLDAIISALNPAADTSSSDSLLDQSEQIHDFESSHQDVLSNGLTTMQGASAISRPHFASALSFIGTVSTSAFQKLDFMQIIYTLPLVIGLIMFLASRAPGRRHDSVRKVDESRPTRHYQNNDAGGYYRWDGHV